MKKKWKYLVMVLLLSILISTSIYAEDDEYESDTPILSYISVNMNYQNGDGKKVGNQFFYKDTLLLEDSGTLSTDLAKASVAIAAAAYNANYVKDTLTTEMGFHVVRDEKANRDYYDYIDVNEDSVRFFIYRKSFVYNNNEYLVYCVPIRGTASAKEWKSNFNLGRNLDGNHQGFYTAANEVKEVLKEQIKKDNSNNDKTVIVWITGHSRGAAVANIVAGQLTDESIMCQSPDSIEGGLVSQNHIFAYTFACPTVSRNLNSNQQNYKNIYNYNNAGDPVPYLPLKSWGYNRYGQTIILDTSEDVRNNVSLQYKKQTSNEFGADVNISQYEATLNDLVPYEANYYENDNQLLFSIIAWIVGGHSWDDFVEYAKDYVDYQTLDYVKGSDISQLYQNVIKLDENCDDLIKFIGSVDYTSMSEEEFKTFLSRNSTQINKVEKIVNFNIETKGDMALAKTALSTKKVNELIRVMRAIQNGFNLLLTDGGINPFQFFIAHNQQVYVIWINSMYYGYKGWYQNRNIEGIIERGVCNNTVDERINTIGSLCFYECYGLKSVDIKWCDYVGYSAFQWASITELILPETGHVDRDAFYGCNNIETITMPIDFDYSSHPFSHREYMNGRSSVPQVKSIHYTVGKTGKMPDRDFSMVGTCLEYISIGTLEEVEFDEGITYIGNNAFRGWENLFGSTHDVAGRIKEFKLPKSLISIGDYAFKCQIRIDGVVFPEYITTIPRGCFELCSGIKEFKITPNIKRIEDYAYSRCSGLIEVEIPNSLEYMGSYVFDKCFNLHTLIIPADFEFQHCIIDSTTITKIHYTYGDTGIIPDVSLNRNEKNYIGYRPEYKSMEFLKEIEFDDGIIRIGNNLLRGLEYSPYGVIESVELPSTLKSIGEYAFYGQRHIKNIDIPDNVEVIEKKAFFACLGLTEVVIGENCRCISESAFGCCSYKNFVIYSENCDIDYWAIGRNDGLTVYGLYGSTINKYCLDRYISFVPLNHPIVVNAPDKIVKCKDESIALEARVYTDIGEYTDNVEWSISNNKSDGTFVSSDGILVIDKYEECSHISVVVRYYDDNDVVCEEYTIPVMSHNEIYVGEVEPTCLKEGLTYGKKCNMCGEIIVKQNVIPALGHDWDKETIIKEPTCLENGMRSYECNRKGCSEKKTEIIPQMGHVNETIPAVKPTCTTEGCTDGKKCSVCGEILAEPAIIEVIGHNYGTPTWKWTGTTKAVATFTCKNDSSHIKKVEATITSNVTTPETCTTSGVRTYTATVKFNGKAYKTTKTEKIAAKGHSYGTPTWKWTGTTKAVATFTCKNDSSHTKKVSATITNKVTKKATVSASGARTYTASVKLNGKTYKKTKTATYYLFDKSKTGIQKYNNNLYYVKKGIKDASFTGFAKYGTKWYYVVKGKVDTTKLGVFKGKVNGVSATWYVKNGKVQLSFTGTVKINNKKYKIIKGKVQ